MRIIAGKAKGRKLLSPEDQQIRPTSDRIKEAVFSMLAFRLPGSKVLDLFCGSGALGLEALSRGAKFADFVDADKKSLDLAKENAKKTDLMEGSTFFLKNAEEYLADSIAKSKTFDIIFLDPPYKKDLALPMLFLIDQKRLLENDGVLIVETAKEEALEGSFETLYLLKEKVYGKTKISVYERKEKDEEGGISGEF